MLRQGKEVGAKLAEEELSNIQNHTELLCTCMAVNSTVNVALFESQRHFMHSKIKRGNCIASLHFLKKQSYRNSSEYAECHNKGFQYYVHVV